MKCPVCPIADGPCIVEVWGGERPHCGWIAECRDGIREQVIRLTAKHDGTWVEPVVPPTVSKARSLIARVNECPHRRPESNCGCNGGIAFCDAGKSKWSDGKVAMSDCIACVSQ